MQAMRWMLAVASGVGLLLTGCADGPDPYRDAVSDRRAPEMTVSVREDAGERVADIAYDPASGRVPMRGTYAYLQTLDGETWSTAYTLSRFLDDGYDEGVPQAENDVGVAGPGPDTYRLPDLDEDDSYRICIDFVIRHHGAIGCSAPFHSS